MQTDSNSVQADVIDEWLGWSQDPDTNTDRMWAIALLSSGHVISFWGRRGSDYRPTKWPFPNVAAAREFYDKKIREKTRRTSDRPAYINVPFDSANYGNVPSFSGGRNKSMAELKRQGRQRIDADYLHSRFTFLIGQLQIITMKRRPAPDPDRIFMEFRQVSMEYEVWSDVVGTTISATVTAARDAVAAQIKAVLLS